MLICLHLLDNFVIQISLFWTHQNNYNFGKTIGDESTMMYDLINSLHNVLNCQLEYMQSACHQSIITFLLKLCVMF